MKATRKAKRKFRIAGSINFDDGRAPITVSKEGEAWHVGEFLDNEDTTVEGFEEVDKDTDAREHFSHLTLTVERLP
jgi:CO dehydrogenase/acetyl-CoA synthase beta subunit